MLMESEDKTRLARVLVAVILTGIVAFALCWGFLRNNRAETGVGMRAELGVTKLSDGPAPTGFDTGQAALSSQSPTNPGSSFLVRNGTLTYKPTADGRSAAYFSRPNMGAPVSSLGARWLFEPGEGPGDAIALVVSQGVQKSMPPTMPPIPVHFIATADNWNLSVVQKTDSQPDIIAQGNPPLKEDSTAPYAPLLYNYVTFEVYSDHGLTDSIIGFQHIWADSARNK